MSSRPARTLAGAARTDVGRVRSQNEDACLVRPDAGLLVAADGMGGHAAGEVASALAVETLAEMLAGGSADGADPLTGERGAVSGRADPEAGAAAGRWSDAAEAREAVGRAVREANRRIHRQGRENPGQRGMGTTVTVLLTPGPERWVMGHVGDSRAYLLRDGELSRVTTDHTAFPGSNTLTRALGTREEVEVDVLDGELRAGDLFVLCSDGLTKMLDDGDIRRIVVEHAPRGTAADPSGRVPSSEAGGGAPGAGDGPDPEALEAAAGALVEEALRRGGDDNVTVVVAGV